MSTDENKALYQRYYAAFQEKNPEELEVVLAPTFVGHDLPPGLPPGPDSLKRYRQMVEMAFSDQETKLADVIAEGDRVVGRFGTSGMHQGEFMHIPGTGKRITVELIEIVRIAEGKIAERWVQGDKLGALLQMGVNSMSEQG